MSAFMLTHVVPLLKSASLPMRRFKADALFFKDAHQRCHGPTMAHQTIERLRVSQTAYTAMAAMHLVD